MGTTVSLSPALGKQSFMIGVPCLTISGTYYISFVPSDLTNYYPTPPITVFVDAIGTLSTVTVPATIPPTAQGGVQPLTFTFSDYATEAFAYTFYGDTLANTPTQDPTSAFVTAVSSGTPNSVFNVAPFTNSISGFFQITNVTATGNQKVIANTTYACFATPFSATFAVSSQQQTLSTVSISSAFSAFTNGSSTGSTLPKNSISFVFTPPVAPIFINCQLICSAMVFVDSQIQTGTGFTPNPLVRFYSQYLGSTTTTATVRFDNLVRGMAYQLKCFGTSTQVLASSRTFTQGAVFPTWTGVTPAVPIMTSTPLTAACASFSYLNALPTAAVQQAMINYCQRYFTTTQNPPATSTSTNPACIVDADKESS